VSYLPGFDRQAIQAQEAPQKLHRTGLRSEATRVAQEIKFLPTTLKGAHEAFL